jgi:hypothetical protein
VFDFLNRAARVCANYEIKDVIAGFFTRIITKHGQIELLSFYPVSSADYQPRGRASEVRTNSAEINVKPTPIVLSNAG